MSENIMMQPLLHQRSHSMPASHAFLNNHHAAVNHTNIERNNDNYDFKRSSALKPDSAPGQLTTSDGFPLPIPKSIASQFRSNLATTVKNEDADQTFFCKPKTSLNVFNVTNSKEDYINCPVAFNCKMDRGFFISQSHWTCYRRNYFQVSASFTISGHFNQARYALQLNSDTSMQPIQQFLVRLRACTATSSFLINGNAVNENDGNPTLKNHNLIRPIALTQMTPKRDKGPQREPPSIPINPSDNMYSSEQSCVTFERLQFKVATANNGKRRASQQFFRLVFELVAQLDDESQHVVSECYSSPLVVRGRSPGHYNNDTTSEYEVSSRKKRKPSPIKRPSPSSPRSFIVNSPSTQDQQHQEQHQDQQSVVTLPPPQYVYAPPSMVIDTRETSESIATSNESPVSYNSPHSQQPRPLISPISFGTIHGRSQSANDSEFFVRHRNYTAKLEYHQMQQQQNGSGLFGTYHIGMERALKNWQQQIVRQRTESAATFHSYDNSDRTSTKSDTPFNNTMYHEATSNSPYWRSNQYNEDKLSQQQQDFQNKNPTKFYQ